jgi:hypothetical protein
VRKVDASGTIRTIAGTGAAGFGLSDLPAGDHAVVITVGDSVSAPALISVGAQ